MKNRRCTVHVGLAQARPNYLYISMHGLAVVMTFEPFEYTQGLVWEVLHKERAKASITHIKLKLFLSLV